ncbi:protein kinase domain containing protein [Acanthamoeba castellanii str. Neff]|uniref:Protein kinase domain containing protein n=1 Tax=Acanthamoeba castellanii (strain ATCC 30010 / Neff) TaxID=1257118 RepID=L8GZD8_ACACF|nr:protein kinase domain containing protein [Acanthamoeba castellanii str. Neff]ELR18375.1 protein kinase domain containing protein [Acanthamoeba castellanii str. Neff]
MWNDTAIQNLNPELAPFLPQKAIRIVYQSNNSSITLTFNTAMGQRVPEYAQVIGFVSGFGDSPAIKNGAGVPVNGFGFPQMLDATTYSFGLTISQQLTKKVLPVSLWNTAGRLVSPTTESVLSAIQDNVDLLNSGADIYTLYFAPGENSWPIIAINSMIFHSRNMPDCRKAKALVDWIYWIQTDPFGKSIMDSSGFVAPYRVQEFTKTLFKKLASVTCEGVHVSQLYGCVTEDGLLCSDHGTCTEGVCSCEAGWVGSLCDTVDSRSSDSSSSPVLGLALGIALPVVVLIVCLALLVVLIVFLAMRRGKETEAFVQEMRVMSKLRHPNVVLFMAACKKPPILCIVMEYMALGSVFDLINNDLVPDVPMGLKLKMTFQAAKGMHFLHSSDIVHRDLKSLNLLLDNKWNVKVSDFGLTAIKDSIGKGGDKALVCSVPWTAPEVLQDEVGEDVDYTMADVYSFGIVLWETKDYSADSRDKEMGLCSSNCCPWIVDSRRISLGESLGEGNYGRVYRGTYNGKPVAVKRLFNSRLDDRGMLMLRREAAILSDLVHPNIVQLIGLSLSEGNLILVMELVERGSLHYVLADRSLKLSWPKRLSMLRDAALGINYLHSLGVIHRDLKSHNLLVDENWGVKVGDFGFATAKQDNATMTRCGTPSWTAPEILSPPPGGAKYDESVDVYSFGIVMWEVLTRRAPYHEKNAVCVAVDVIQGQRPPIPPDTDKQFAQLMQRCWDASPRKRPSMDEIMAYLNSALDKIEV